MTGVCREQQRGSARRARALEDLASSVGELVDEVRTLARVETWRPTREHPDYADPRVRLPSHASTVTHATAEPGLLTQLARGVGRRRRVLVPAGEVQVDASWLTGTEAPIRSPRYDGPGGGGGKPGSKPPAQWETTVAFLDLERAISRARGDVRTSAGLSQGRRKDAAGMVRELVELCLRGTAAGPLVPDVQVERVARQARSWVTTARVALSYDAPIAALRAPCPDCGGELRVRADASSDVWCSGAATLEGPALEGDDWPIRWRCGAKWPRASWVLLLQALEADEGQRP